MQIELIGCTGAGKSTLARNLVQTGRRQGIDIVLAEDFVLRQLRLHWISVPLLRKVLVNVAGLIASVFTWPKNGGLYLFAIRAVYALPISKVEKLGLLRNVLKKVGISEIVHARGGSQRIIILDEGALHIAHNLFVHVAADVEMEAIREFARLVALPDLVLYVRGHEPTMIERVVSRGHRRITDASQENVARFVRQAVTTFDRLVQEPAVKNRLLLLDGVQASVKVGSDEYEPVVASILDFKRMLGQPYVA